MHNYFRVIHAFDKDPKRYEILRTMVSKAGATNVHLQLSDFLKVRAYIHV